MTVACKMLFCPYHKNDFCCKDIVCIDENGHCNEIWRKGKRREINNYKEVVRKEPIVLEGEIKEDATT